MSTMEELCRGAVRPARKHLGARKRPGLFASIEAEFDKVVAAMHRE